MVGQKAASQLKPKQRRITRACDYCHQRSIRCRPSDDGSRCENCKSFAQECTYYRKPRRRGAPPRSAKAIARSKPQDEQHTPAVYQGSFGMDNPGHPSTPQDEEGCRWVAPNVVSQATIIDLVELYFEVVYPIFPFFHQPSFIRSISRADYMSSKSLFTTTMAVCALVSGRVRDGSVTNPRWDIDHLKQTSPDLFYNEARKQLVDVSAESDFNTIRAHAILAITAIQHARIRDMHQHLGTYHTLVAMYSLHDESCWPQNIGVIEREERRRLFWSIYTLDIYTSVVWGGILRSREQQSNVAYPAEMDDEDIDENSVLQPALGPNSVISWPNRRALTVQSDCWLSGWNFITDLYRVLEHALARFRGHGNRVRRGTFLAEIFQDESTVTETSVCNSVLQMYINLPSCFRQTPKITHNVKKDLFGFQAANITASVQLVRMVLFAAAGVSIQERCQVAQDVLDAFASIPVEYLVAISAPLLHHLGVIATVLGTVFEERLSETDYDRVRTIMLSMASLLESLETIQQRPSASKRLKLQVARIDDYMIGQRQAAIAQNAAQALHPPQTTSCAPIHSILEQPPPQPGAYASAHNDISHEWYFQVPADILADLAYSLEFGYTWGINGTYAAY